MGDGHDEVGEGCVSFKERLEVGKAGKAAVIWESSPCQ